MVERLLQLFILLVSLCIPDIFLVKISPERLSQINPGLIGNADKDPKNVGQLV
jgi:hypothetical protein